MRDTEREAETQVEGEAGSMHRKPDVGFDPGSPGSRPGPKAGAKPLHHQGCPTMNFLQRVGTNHLKISVQSEKTLNSQENTEKENQSRGHHNGGFQAVLQSCGHQDSVVLAQKKTHRSMEQNRESRSGP